MIPGSANPLLLAPAAGGYQVSRSLRFNSSDSGFCSRTPAVAGNRTIYTWSFWLKRSGLGEYHVFRATSDGSNYTEVYFGSNDKLNFQNVVGGSANTRFVTTQVFRDTSAWYHLVFSINGSTAAKLYVNGVEVTVFDTTVGPGSSNHQINNTVSHTIGSSASSSYANFYLADIHFISGQALDHTSFTEVSATTGQLIPKAYSGSFGTNGFWLKFSDNSAATAAALGNDYSGNNNDWTPNNLSVTAGAGNDSLVDTPTSYGTDTGVGGEVRGNYATLNPLDKYTGTTLANGNLDATSDANGVLAIATIAPENGNYYFEVTLGSIVSNSFLGIVDNASRSKYCLYGLNTGSLAQSGFSASSTVSGTASQGDIIGLGFDKTNGTISFYKNGSSMGSITGITFSGQYGLAAHTNTTTSTAWSFNFGQRAFAYQTPGTNRPAATFLALCDTNLPAPLTAKPNTLMDVKLYTGNGSTQTISGLAFSPDLVWIKSRSGADNHAIQDAVRGATLVMQSNTTNAEVNASNTVGSFTSDGFSLAGAAGSTNGSSVTYVAWAWDAGTSTDPSNQAGSITSQVRANVSAGFSVVTYTGTGSAATVGHGLGVVPSLIICKVRNTSDNWCVYHVSIGASLRLNLNTTAGTTSGTAAWGTTPTSTVFSIGTSGEVNTNSNTFVAYAFAPVVGYSSFGSYTGTGTSDGSFIFLGFRPKWFLLKPSTAADSWRLFDSVRNTYNYVDLQLSPSSSNAEVDGDTDYAIDFLSNGVKIRAGNSGINGSGVTFVYAAFAENPFQYARAR